MRVFGLRLPSLALFFLIFAPSVAAQDNRLLALHDPVMEAIVRLQQRGMLLELPPTAPPYRFGAIREALEALDGEALGPEEQRWARLLWQRVGPRPETEATAGLQFTVWGSAGTNERFDPVRHVRTGGPMLQTGDVTFYEAQAMQLYFDAGPVVAQWGARRDRYLNDEPDGIDIVKRYMGRSQDAYGGIHTRYASLYVGNYHQHWGVPGEAALLVSDNPASYDHVALRLGGERFSVRSLLGELDSITLDDRFTGRVGDLPEGGKQRFLAGHRFDWRPVPQLTIAFMETSLYSGTGASMSPRFLVPTHAYVFLVDNVPKNVEQKGLIGGLLWGHWRGFTLHGQLLVDDIDFGSWSEPASIALAGSLTRAGLRPTRPGGALSSVDLGAALEFVTLRTYNTHQVEGQYVFALRGLATQFSDYAHVRTHAAMHLDGLLPGLTVQPELHFLWQGEGDIRMPFPGNELDSFLLGVHERTARLGSVISFQPDHRYWLRANLGLNRTWNEDHVPGNDVTRFLGWIEGGVRIDLSTGFGLDF